MFILDFDRQPRSAFWHGLVKGMAAPALLYHTENAPHIPELVPLTPPRVGVQRAMTNSWLRVGRAFSRVQDEHDTNATQR